MVDGTGKRGRAVRREHSVACARRAFLSALAGNDERAAVLETRLIADRGSEDVNLQRRAAPAYAEIRRGLREEATRAGGTVSPRIADAVRRLEQDGCGRRCVARQLAREAALPPGEVKRDTKMLADRVDVAGCAGPIHERRALAVDIMMVQLDRVSGHARIEEVQEGGKAVLAATERNDEAPVGAEVGGGRPERSRRFTDLFLGLIRGGEAGCAEKIAGCGFGLGSGSHDRAGIIAKHLEPGAEVRRMIVDVRSGQSEIRAKQRRC